MKRIAEAVLLALAIGGCDSKGGQADNAAANLPQDRLSRAIRTAFPRSTTLFPGSAASVSYAEHRLVDTGFGPVLVSRGNASDAGRAVPGSVAIRYLAAQGDAFRIRPELVVVKGGAYGQAPSWTLTRAYSDFPVVQIDDGAFTQGCRSRQAVLVELAPEGPREVAKVVTQYDRDPEHLQGEIVDIARGKGFTVRYRGTRSFDARYLRRGASFVPAANGNDMPEAC